MTGVATYWRTLRHLKAGQVLGRVRFRLARPAPELHAAPPLRAPAAAWLPPAQREASLVGPSRFRFMHVEHDLAQVGWDDPAVDRLWRYQLHYFDDLNALDAASRAEWHHALLARWRHDNPPARGTGWEPYPVSLRIVNWIKWQLAGAALDADTLHSLAVQARWLCRRLEWHLLGNHLFANAKALLFAGAFFDGAEAASWLRTGLAIVQRELDEQVLADGGHFERSTMYHALALEDLLDLINLAGARAAPGLDAARWREAAMRMLHWQRCLQHRDGQMALFNDAAAGVAPDAAQLEAYAARLGVQAAQPADNGVNALMPSGYVRMARGAALALLDVAPVGPDYLPGHAHADTLSFELSLRARRVFVNGGTSCYGLGAQRHRERGTAWHNTVQLAGQDSSEVWSGFRVGRRARITGLRVDGWAVEAAHDGYRFLRGAPQHRRRWQLDEGALQVDDHIEPAGAHEAVARFHLAPGLRLQATADTAWAVLDGDTPIARVQVDTGTGRVEAAMHAPRFGVLLDTQCLAVTLAAGRATTRISW